MEAAERLQLLYKCGKVWNPSAPINKLELFSGRTLQTEQIINAINTTGKHAVLYGDRGVGKTSLVSVLGEALKQLEDTLMVVKVNCSETDLFQNVWRKMLSHIPEIKELFVHNDPNMNVVELTLADMLDKHSNPGPGEIRSIVQKACNYDFQLILVFDEFDRLAESERDMFSDTIKDFSDNSVNATLVMVGVANNVLQLISEHASIVRCLEQIPMPRMDVFELQKIIETGLKILGMSMEKSAIELIVCISQGLPYYTHALAQGAAKSAINKGVLAITEADVTAAIDAEIKSNQHTVLNDYLCAAWQKDGTIFPQVLLACAMAKTDDLGFFTSSDVRTPLQAITNEDYDIPNYAQHLNKFSDEAKGNILEKTMVQTKIKYRFKNPLLKSFIIMKALGEKILKKDLLDYIRPRELLQQAGSLF